MHHGVTRSLGVKHCTGVKCNPHGVDIPFFVYFFIFFVISLPRVHYRQGYLQYLLIFFTKRRRSAVIAFLGGSHQISYPLPKKSPKTPFWQIFQCKPIVERVLRQSRVNGATKLKIYSYIDIGKYLRAYQNFYARVPPGSAGPLNVNLGPPNISETTRARKLNLKIRCGKAPALGTKIIILYDTT